MTKTKNSITHCGAASDKKYFGFKAIPVYSVHLHSSIQRNFIYSITFTLWDIIIRGLKIRVKLNDKKYVFNRYLILW